jgi:choline dehydrogenase-like flavoprotein
MVSMPAGWGAMTYSKKHSWGHMTEPEKWAGGRRLMMPRGKVLGGSSSINGMVYVRGHAKDFDLVVTDYRMPDIDGIAVAQTINQRYPNLRCTVVTGDVSTDTLASARAAGVGPVLRKPFAPREYEDLIRRCTS